MQMMGRGGGFLRSLSYFTTTDASKKRKTGNVERLFLKKRSREKKRHSFIYDSALFALPLLCGMILLFLLPSYPKPLASTVVQTFAQRDTALAPMERPVSAFCEDGAYLSVFYVMGDRGEDVLALENALTALGYDVGDADGIYTHQSARAVRRFQSDRGFSPDGVCTEALCHTAISLAASGDAQQKTVSNEILADALFRAGCMTEEQALASAQNGQYLRDALILFQRSQGLNGVGEVNYATLSALGLGGIFVYTEDIEPSDLQTYMIASYLARFSDCYPKDADLHTLICVAASLYNRAVQDGGGAPSLSVVCSAAILGEKSSIGNALAPNALCLRAAEDALLRVAAGNDPVRGATSYLHSSYYEAYAKNATGDTVNGQTLTRRVGEFYFFK